MSTVAWILIAWLGLNAVVDVLRIGKQREPKTPFEAVCDLVEIGLAIWAVLYLAGAL